MGATPDINSYIFTWRQIELQQWKTVEWKCLIIAISDSNHARYMIRMTTAMYSQLTLPFEKEKGGHFKDTSGQPRKKLLWLQLSTKQSCSLPVALRYLTKSDCSAAFHVSHYLDWVLINRFSQGIFCEMYILKSLRNWSVLSNSTVFVLFRQLSGINKDISVIVIYDYTLGNNTPKNTHIHLCDIF